MIEWVSTSEAAKMLGCSPRSFLRNYCTDCPPDGVVVLRILKKHRVTWRVSLVSVKLLLKRGLRSDIKDNKDSSK